MVLSVMGGSIAFAGTAAAANTVTSGAGNSGDIAGNTAIDPASVTEGSNIDNHIIRFTVTDVQTDGDSDTVNVTVANEIAQEGLSVNGVSAEFANNDNQVSISSSAELVDGPDGDGVDDTIQFGIQPDDGVRDIEFQVDVTTNAPSVTSTTNYGISASFVDSGGDDIASTTFTQLEVVDTANGGYLSGRVSDTQNDDVANAIVRATGGGVTASTRTNADGEYTLRVPVGTYDITVERRGYTTATANDNEVDQGQTTTANLVIEQLPTEYRLDVTVDNGNKTANIASEGTANATVTVEQRPRGSTDAWLPAGDQDVTLELTNNDILDPNSTTVTTDSNGDATVEFQAENIGNTNVTASTEANDGTPYSTSNSEEATVSVYGVGEITGDVVNEDDDELAAGQATVSLYRLGTNNVVATSEIGQGGSYVFTNVPSGFEYRMVATTDGGLSGSAVTENPIDAGNTTTNDIVVTGAEPSPPNGGNSVVDQFDTNGEAGIQPGEAQDAIAALNNNQIDPSGAQAVIAALNS